MKKKNIVFKNSLSWACLNNFLQVKEEFSSTAEIVQTIETMTANLAKVMVLSFRLLMQLYI